MDFAFNETQNEVKGLANQILGDLSTPERLSVIDNSGYRFDEELWKQLAEAGLLGVAFSEENGGMGFGFMELALLIEEVGATVAAVPVIPCLVSAALPVQQFGTDEQKSRLLPAVASGSLLLTAGLSEEFNECPASPQTTATADGGGVVLNGAKSFVPFADKADRILVTAKNGDSVGVYLVDPGAAGVSLDALESTSREPWFIVNLDNVKVAAEDVISSDNGVEIATWTVQRTQAALCAMQVGVCQASLKMTTQYTCERIQFEKPIGAFQAVQHRAADCYIDIQCLQLTTYQAASMLAAGKDATNEVTIAKFWAGDTGHRVSYATQHLHGGTGIDRDYFLWRYSLWARHLEGTLGTSGAMLAKLGERIASGEAFAE